MASLLLLIAKKTTTTNHFEETYVFNDFGIAFKTKQKKETDLNSLINNNNNKSYQNIKTLQVLINNNIKQWNHLAKNMRPEFIFLIFDVRKLYLASDMDFLQKHHQNHHPISQQIYQQNHQTLSDSPSKIPSNSPSNKPSKYPTNSPTIDPTKYPTTQIPAPDPSLNPTKYPTNKYPSINPTNNPNVEPTFQPTIAPSINPSQINVIEYDESNTEYYNIFGFEILIL